MDAAMLNAAAAKNIVFIGRTPESCDACFWREDAVLRVLNPV
jgi:hypothetical protein